jgi:hypothetical protein
VRRMSHTLRPDEGPQTSRSTAVVNLIHLNKMDG